ncbi:MAG: M12 family metallopeptidase [Candidatus Solibacter sp.]
MRLAIICTLFSVISAVAQTEPEVRSLNVNGRIVRYEVRGGFAVVEGDIIIGPAADVEAAAQDDPAKSARPRAVVLNFNTANPQKWPDSTMPYVIDSDIPSQQRILDGINHWNTRTQFKIVPRTNEANYVHFVRSTTLDAACSSFLGMIGGGQTIATTDGCTAGSVIHELGHAWGLHHEQVRADRNGNVTVLYQNMDKRFLYNFDQALTSTHDAGYYDFDSIMHYGPTGFTRNGLDSMETVPVGIPIGQRGGLSAGDIDGISRAYGFTPTQTTITSVPAGLTLSVDGVSVTTPKSFDWSAGSTHTVNAPEVTGSADPRYVFVRWSDSPQASHTITASAGQTVFCAVYQIRHRFSYDVGSGQGTVTAAPASEDGYLPERQPVRITATPAEGSQFVRWAATGTTALSAANVSVSTTDAVVQVAAANTQYLGTFTTSTVTTIKSDPPTRIVVVDGTSYLTPVNLVWAQGSSHTLIVTPAQTFGNNTAHYDFLGWDDGGTATTRTVTAGSAPTFTARFSTKYLLSTSTSGAGRVTVSPPSSDGYYDAGTEVTLTAVPNAGATLRYWLGDFAGGALEQRVIMNDQHDATAIFGSPLPFAVLSAASFIGNPQFDATGFVVAPGEIVTIFGANLGPATLTTAQLDSTGKIATSLAGTRVLFDGVPAPLIYTSTNQVSVVVPFSVAGKTQTRVAPEYNGVPLTALIISAGESAPGLFTANASGTGQIAALNQDYSINSVTRPAEPGSVVQLYATGGGEWTEAIADGAITGSHLVAPKLPVWARVGKLPAQILYVGTAPDLVNGALQINIVLPKELIGGPAVPIQISVGSYTSPPGTTLAAR